MMKKNKLLAAVAICLICFPLFYGGVLDRIFKPIFKTDTEGIKGQIVLYLGDLTASIWVYGDTAATGWHEIDQTIKITDVALYGDPDAGDSLFAVLYAVNMADSSAEVICISDTLVGSAWRAADTTTVSSTYNYIDKGSEWFGGIYLDVVASPNSCTLIIDYETAIQDRGE